MPIRVIKGQDVLPDGSTLEKHGIIDGSTVNIEDEDYDKVVNLRLKLGPKEFTSSVMNYVRVIDLKLFLIDNGGVGFSINEFQLIVSADDNEGVAADFPLLDESLPLNLYGVSENTMIRIIGGRVQIILVTSKGKRWHKYFSRSMTISQMKQRIRRFLGYDKDLDGIWLFVFEQISNSYKRLDGDEDLQIGSVLSGNDVIYLVEDRFFADSDVFPVFYREEPIGHFGWKITAERRGGNRRHHSDTALSLKLRIQELLGFPVYRVDVNVRGKMQNDEMLHHDDLNKKIEIRIEVA